MDKKNLPGASQQADKPDEDAIKMLVEQVPRWMDVEHLKPLFEVYGRVYSVQVLRDRLGESKGCCHVRYFTKSAALAAQEALHDVRTLEGMRHPIQMTSAEIEFRNDRKLYVGMLNQEMTEVDVCALFSPYGAIEECIVLRDPIGDSKGCGFVTFVRRQSAHDAAEALGQSQTKGCPSPLFVQFASTYEERQQKKEEEMQAELLKALNPAHLDFTLPPPDPILWSPSTEAALLKHQLLMGRYNLFKPMADRELAPGGANSNLLGTSDGGETTSTAGLPFYEQMGKTDAVEAAGRQPEGLEGCNIVVCGLPPKFSDTDLAAAFDKFGPLISARVLVDTETGLSKRAGIVSFMFGPCAERAAEVMNLSVIQGYIVKVQMLGVTKD